jgi:hypothetical protein
VQLVVNGVVHDEVLEDACSEAPVAQDDSVTTTYQQSITIDVLANDSGDALSIMNMITLPQQGTATITGNTIVYTPNADFPAWPDARTDAFTYQVVDAQGQTALARVTVEVNRLGMFLQCAELSFQVWNSGRNNVDFTLRDSTGVITTSTVSAHNSIAISLSPTSGTVQLLVHNIVHAEIAEDYCGEPPVAQDDVAWTVYRQEIVINALANDSDSDGNGLMPTIITPPMHGTATIDDNHGMHYTPAEGFPAPGIDEFDSFTYTIDDGQGHTASATVTVEVVRLQLTAQCPTGHFRVYNPAAFPVNYTWALDGTSTGGSGSAPAGESFVTVDATSGTVSLAISGIEHDTQAIRTDCEPPCDDQDQDGICDEVDNCPQIPNLDQTDSNGDGVGDACSTTGYQEPGIACPAGFELVTVWRRVPPPNIEALRWGIDDSDTYTFSLSDTVNGELVVWSMVGHPEAGCPGGTSPLCREPDQLNEHFNIAVDGTFQSYVPDTGNHQWSQHTNVSLPGLSAGEHQITFTHAGNDNGNYPNPSVSYKVGLCVAALPEPLCSDGDLDGICDEVDNCPAIANPDQADVDSNGTGDLCEVETCTDGDLDGICDEVDNCPAVANPDQADADSNGTGDLCEVEACADSDLDGVCDEVDNCPAIANPDQADADSNGTGDLCDVETCTDSDLDGICDDLDNCPAVANPDQVDTNANGTGDLCEPVQSIAPTLLRLDNLKLHRPQS